MNSKKVLLMILDGWGIGKKDNTDAIFKGETPYIDSLYAKYPNATILTSGEDVGLPNGQMGNSEVGHLNIGAGRVVYQDLVKINKAIEDNSIASNKVLVEALNYAKENNKKVHFIGLVSDGGVHSLDTHLYKLCDLTKDYGLEKVYIHAITDGRDTDPRSGLGFIENLSNHLKSSNGEIATLVGRYYAMDRDKRWDRVKRAYDLYTKGTGIEASDVVTAVKESYSNNITDEFIEPTVFNKSGLIEANDVVICFNYRTDRLRELTTVLSQQDMVEEGMTKMPLHYVTMTSYDQSFKGVNVIFTKDNLKNTLGEVLANNNKKQIRIAETEKYAHVTFFFNGGQEEEFAGEKRILKLSPKVATYDLQPEMSAYEVKDAIVEELKNRETDFICLNFANGDMVGHTGVMSAILKAVNAVDTCVNQVVETATANDYTTIIIADHGNADNAVNLDGSPNTAHSTNPVPIIVVNSNYKTVENGILADIAPTILKIMGIDQPAEMTGKVLVK